MKPIVGIAFAILATGCGTGSGKTEPPAAHKRDALAKQLAGMSPDQRVEYIRQHPEAAGTLSGVPSQTP